MKVDKVISFDNPECVKWLYKLTFNEFTRAIIAKIDKSEEFRTPTDAQLYMYDSLKTWVPIEPYQYYDSMTNYSRVFQIEIPCVATFVFRFAAKRINNICYANKIIVLDVENSSRNISKLSLNRPLYKMLKEPYELSSNKLEQLLFIRQTLLNTLN